MGNPGKLFKMFWNFVIPGGDSNHFLENSSRVFTKHHFFSHEWDRFLKNSSMTLLWEPFPFWYTNIEFWAGTITGLDEFSRNPAVSCSIIHVPKDKNQRLDDFSGNPSSSWHDLEQNWIVTHKSCMDEFSRNWSGSFPENSSIWVYCPIRYYSALNTVKKQGDCIFATT